MKNKFKHLLSLVVVLMLSSCSKEFLEIEPQDKLTIDNFYRNETEIRAATASLYGFPWFDFNDKFFWLVGDCMPGNMYYTYDQEGQFFYFSFTEGSGKRWQYIQISGMTLNQHFPDSGRTTKVPINLKRRMGIKQIRITAGSTFNRTQ